MKTWKAELLLLIVTMIWGATFTFTKLGLEVTTVFFFLFLRFSLALTLSLAIWGKYLIPMERKILNQGLILGMLFSGGFILQTMGLSLTTVTKSAFITGIAVVLTPFAFKLIIKKKIKIYQTCGVVIAAVGLWLFTNPVGDALNIGDILTLMSAFFWAFYITLMDVYTKEIKTFNRTIQLVILQFIVAMPTGLLGFLLFEADSFKFMLTPNLIIALLYNGIIASIFLTLIHTSVQKYSNPVKAALIFSLEPVFAALVAYFTFNESLTNFELFGAAILFSGVIFSEIGEYIVFKIRSWYS